MPLQPSKAVVHRLEPPTARWGHGSHREVMPRVSLAVGVRDVGMCSPSGAGESRLGSEL